MAPMKWIVVFVGDTKYDSDFQIKNYIEENDLTFNLIIVGLNIT